MVKRPSNLKKVWCASTKSSPFWDNMLEVLFLQICRNSEQIGRRKVKLGDEVRDL